MYPTSFRAKKSMINDGLIYSSSTALQYLFDIYKRQVFKPFSKWFFFAKIYQVIYIENKKKIEGLDEVIFFKKI